MHNSQSFHGLPQPSELPSYTRARRPSYNSKRNSVSSIRSDYPALRAPPSPCPKDADAFSFFPQYLAEWHMSDTLWDALPNQLHKPLAALQHAGAAAMTAFDRIEALRKELDGKVDEHSELEDDIPASTPSLTSQASVPNSGNHSPHNATTTPSTPITPLDLGPGFEMRNHDAEFNSAKIRTFFHLRTKSFTHYTPPAVNPRIARWRAELSTLREETMVRVRHALRKVESEWRGILWQQPSKHSTDPLHAEAWAVLTTQFNDWLDRQKMVVGELDVQAKALGTKVCLGWGDV